MSNPLSGISDGFRRLSETVNRSAPSAKPSVTAGSAYAAVAVEYNPDTGDLWFPSLLDRDIFGDEGFRLANDWGVSVGWELDFSEADYGILYPILIA